MSNGRLPDEILNLSDSVRQFCYQAAIWKMERNKDDKKNQVEMFKSMFGAKK